MYNILLVEDDPIFQMGIKQVLQSLKNVKIIATSTGEDALKIIASEIEIDVFIIDIILPGMDGIELLLELRKCYPYAPVIIESSITSYERQAMILNQFHNYAYFSKPFSPDLFKQNIVEILIMVSKKKKKFLRINNALAINIQTILYIEKLNGERCIKISIYNDRINKAKEIHIKRFTLNEVLKQVKDKKELLRSSKSFIINPEKITYVDYDNKELHLCHTDQKIPLGDTYINDLNRKLEEEDYD